MSEAVYQFDWDANKARTNLSKHRVAFSVATSIFRDALALTIFDDDQSDNEDRWVTLGFASSGQYLVVIHTVKQTSPGNV